MMSEQDRFEQRLTTAVRAYAAEPRTIVDAQAVAQAIAANDPRRAGARWLGRLGVAWTRTAWIGVALLLLAGALAFVAIGALVRDEHGITPEIRRIVDAVNADDVEGLRSSFGAQATFIVPGVVNRRGELGSSGPWAIHEVGRLEWWLKVANDWDHEADVRSCRSESTATIRCSVVTRWPTLHMEISEMWTFVMDSSGMTSLEMIRLDADPPNRTVPLRYSELDLWESWLRETHPDQAERLLAWSPLFGHVLFRYDAAQSGQIGASIEEFLENRDDFLSNRVKEPRVAAGTGTAGTLDDAARIWSGPVQCEWDENKGAVDVVTGFDVPVTDAVFVPSRDPFDGTVTSLDLRQAQGLAQIRANPSQAFDVDLDMSADRRTGTATTASGDVTFGWACNRP